MRCIDPNAHDIAWPRGPVSPWRCVFICIGLTLTLLVAAVGVADPATAEARSELAAAKPKPPPAKRPNPKARAGTEKPDVAVDVPKEKLGLPSGVETRRLVKITLITFNNAVKTGNFSVLHTKAATPFRRKYKPAGLRWLFRDFRARKIDIAAIVNLEPIWAEAPQVDNNGQLRLRGYFATLPSQVRFDLSYAKERKSWRLTRIGIDVGAPQ